MSYYTIILSCSFYFMHIENIAKLYYELHLKLTKLFQTNLKMYGTVASASRAFTFKSYF